MLWEKILLACILRLGRLFKEIENRQNSKIGKFDYKEGNDIIRYGREKDVSLLFDILAQASVVRSASVRLCKNIQK